MPTISFFYGIYISMYVDEHNPPHFHAEYQVAELLENWDNATKLIMPKKIAPLE